MGAWAGLKGCFLGAWRRGTWVVQRHGCCGGGRYIVVDELRHCSGGDVVDEGEGREEENGCRPVLW